MNPNLSSSSPYSFSLTSLCICILSCLIFENSLTSAELSWRKPPQDSKVRIGENVTFSCEIDGLTNPNLRVIWQKQKTILFVDHDPHEAPTRYKIMGSKDNGEYNLLIMHAERSDDDAFTCSVSKSLKQEAKLTVLVAPEVPQISLDRFGEVTAGQIVKFNCSSNGGNPSPKVTWIRNNQVIKSGHSTTPAAVKFGTTSSVLTWTLTRNDHQAAFSCSVENEAISGSPKSTSRVMQVQYGPVVTFTPGGSVNVLEHDSFTLTCNVDANPSVNGVTWFRGGSRQPETGKVYQIINASPVSHSTVYECVAGNKISEGRNTTTIDVIYAPKVSILQAVSGRIVINESSSLSLTCQVDARPEAHTVMWKKPGRVPVQGPVLTLNNVKRQQGGVYTCEATNQLLPTGKPAKSGVSNASVELVVQYAPGVAVITQKPSGQVVQGQEVTLTCEADHLGNPAGKLLWTKEGDAGFRFEGSVLRLSPAGLQDNGVFTCTPVNKLGAGQAAKREITVNEPVSFLMPLLEAVKFVHISTKDVQVMCRVRGKPLPQITWYKNGRAISAVTSSDEFSILRSHGSVDVYSHIVTSRLLWKGSGRTPTDSSLAVEDSGNYTCLASNGVASDKSRTMQFQVQYAPQIIVQNSRLAVDMNETVALVCTAHSLPRPYFDWYHNGQKILTGGRHGLEVKQFGDDPRSYRSVLNISRVQHNDLGQYQCYTYNDIGNNSASIHLTVKTVPEKPVSLAILKSTWESVYLQWTAGFNGGYPQSFVIHVTSTTKPARRINVSPLHVTVYNVTELFPRTEYTFKVFGENALGSGLYSSPVSMTTDNFVIPPPEKPVYNVEQSILTFKSPSTRYCIRIYVSADGETWSLQEPCAPSVGGSVKLRSSAAINHVNVSLCLDRRPEICSATVLAKIVPGSAEVSSALIIGVGCACGAIIVILIITVIVIYMYRRKHTKDTTGKSTSAAKSTANGHVPLSNGGGGVVNPVHSSEMEKENRNYNANGRIPNSQINNHAPNNNNRGQIPNGGHSNQPHVSFSPWGYESSSNRTPPPEYTQQGPVYNQHPPAYNPVPDAVYSSHKSHPGHYGNSHSQSQPKTYLSPIYEAGNKNSLISDSTSNEMNSSGESMGHYSSGSSQGMPQRYFPMETHYHGEDSESGYSTPEPSKPKKKVYEVIV